MTTNTQITEDRILILDFGSQYSQLIARRVREAGVYSEMYAFDMSEEDIRAFNPNGIILSGGPESVHEEGSPRAPEVVFNLGVPVLGICYGLQTMSAQLGGKVEPGTVHEFGYAEVNIQVRDKLIGDLEDTKDQHQHQQHHGRAMEGAGDGVGADDDGQRREDLGQGQGRVGEALVDARAQDAVPDAAVQGDGQAQQAHVVEGHEAHPGGVDGRQRAGAKHVGRQQRALDAQLLPGVAAEQQLGPLR